MSDERFCFLLALRPLLELRVLCPRLVCTSVMVEVQDKSAQKMNWSLDGVDPNCKGGLYSVADACGVEEEDGWGRRRR